MRDPLDEADSDATATGGEGELTLVELDLLVEQRRARLAHLIRIMAPDAMIQQETQLIARAEEAVRTARRGLS
mgnify:CR=1 FL=1